MNQSQKIQQIPDIDGSVLKAAREGRHLSQAELAKMLCLSIKQVDQLERGASSSFYSLKHRYQVALKVATYLGLNDKEIWQVSDIVVPVHASEEHEISVLNRENSEPELPTFSAKPTQNSDALVTELQQKNPQSKKWLFASVGSVLSAILAVVIVVFGDLTDHQLDQVAVAKEDVEVAATPVFDLCDMTLTSGLISLSVDAPVKKGNSVTVVSKVDQAICIIDNSKKVTSLSLLPESKQVIVGEPPFMIQTTNLNELEIYFQGRKVRYAADLKGPIKLTEGAFNEVVNQ